MTLKPIQGAPNGAPIPDFPIGEPAPVGVQPSRVMRHPGEPMPVSLPPSAPAPARSPAAWQPGPVEIRDGASLALTFRIIPEVPAINRSSMTISIAGEPAGDAAPRTTLHLDLATDEAKAFLLALRDGTAPIVIADSRTGFQIEFVIAADGPSFTVGRPGQDPAARRFNPGWGFDVKAMAAHLLADLGP
jgi:hypothetical protein